MRLGGRVGGVGSFFYVGRRWGASVLRLYPIVDMLGGDGIRLLPALGDVGRGSIVTP